MIGAIANLGPHGRELLPDLSRIRGQFSEVDAAITLAEASILRSQSQGEVVTAKESTAQAKILNDVEMPVEQRLAAAEFFGSEDFIKNFPDMLGQVIEPLFQAMKGDRSLDVRRAAAESVKNALASLRGKPASTQFKDLMKQYIAGLSSILATPNGEKDPHITSLRIFAAEAMGNLAEDFERYSEEFFVPTSLIRAANLAVESDQDVNSVAQKALDKIAGKDNPRHRPDSDAN